jgi:hypothetical protein
MDQHLQVVLLKVGFFARLVLPGQAVALEPWHSPKHVWCPWCLRGTTNNLRPVAGWTAVP